MSNNNTQERYLLPLHYSESYLEDKVTGLKLECGIIHPLDYITCNNGVYTRIHYSLKDVQNMLNKANEGLSSFTCSKKNLRRITSHRFAVLKHYFDCY
jgi:hypothetical protein